MVYVTYRDYVIRDWHPSDRPQVTQLIAQVLAEYGLPWQPDSADRDVVRVEQYYGQARGEFWVITPQEEPHRILGTGAYYPIHRGTRAVEIRKMYFLPSLRGQGLGQFLLSQLEMAIAARGFQEIWIETATMLREAVALYQKNHYQPTQGVETARCDLVLYKSLVPQP